MFLVWKQTYLRGKFNCTISSVILKQGELRRNKTFLLCMYFYITLHCIDYSPSIPLSRHQGPTIPYYPPSLGPIPLLRVPSSSYSLLLTASLYDPVSGSNRWNPCTHVHPCQGLWAHGVSRRKTANHPLTTPKSKFVSLREFRIRDYQSDGVVRPAWIPGDYNPASGWFYQTTRNY